MLPKDEFTGSYHSSQCYHVFKTCCEECRMTQYDRSNLESNFMNDECNVLWLLILEITKKHFQS